MTRSDKHEPAITARELGIRAALGYLQDAGPGHTHLARQAAERDDEPIHFAEWVIAEARYAKQLARGDAQENINLQDSPSKPR